MGDFKATTKVHEIENADYLATHKDCTESSDTLDEGILTLKAQAHDAKQLQPRSHKCHQRIQWSMLRC